MNEQLQEALIGFVAMITTAIQTAGGYAAEQFPVVISQLLMWEFSLSLLWFTIGVLTIAAGGYGAKLIVKGVADHNANIDKERKRLDDAITNNEAWVGRKTGYGMEYYKEARDILDLRRDNAGPIPAMVFCCAALLGLTIMFCNLTWAKIAIAPDVWLLEYAARLVV
jgi:hypothetical protein